MSAIATPHSSVKSHLSAVNAQAVDSKRRDVKDAFPMEDDDRPVPSGGVSKDAAQALASESLESYSQDELSARIRLLEIEIERVKAHAARASAHRLAADALFRPRA
ncbi:DUF1192 domain-containing protein [Novosphingobium terrae]|jgi:uncharacterized small protein (DUF1192 family)|uniref:DUF1192 domain-containing protein n=1 Tax=Novosphingobium terrae TaxID=2726189 RepID=UPI002AC35A1F|nr:DUF1192 domain-containing protein [Novosphingobium terrae]